MPLLAPKALSIFTKLWKAKHVKPYRMGIVNWCSTETSGMFNVVSEVYKCGCFLNSESCKFTRFLRNSTSVQQERLQVAPWFCRTLLKICKASFKFSKAPQVKYSLLAIAFVMLLYLLLFLKSLMLSKELDISFVGFDFWH